jgi:hypothetical protein
MENVDQGIIILGKRNWKSPSLNRDEWKKLLKETRDHTGLSSHR